MYRLQNTSTTALSINGANLAPQQIMTVEKVTAELRYLEQRRALRISRVPIVPPANSPISPRRYSRRKTKVTNESFDSE